jgi:hypothetical protein
MQLAGRGDKASPFGGFCILRKVPARARYNQNRNWTLERDTEVEIARQLIAGKPAAFDPFVDCRIFPSQDF